MDITKFAEAIAWPTAIIFVTIGAVLITRMVITKQGTLGIKWKDWFDFEVKASEQLAGALATSPTPQLEAEQAVSGGENVSLDPRTQQALSDSSGPRPITVTDGKDAFDRLIDAESLNDLEAAFGACKDEDKEGKYLELYTTYYIDKKKEIGVVGTAEELQKLADANPTWFAPLLSLLRSALTAHDRDAASKIITQLLARRVNESASAYVLKKIIEAYFTLFSPEEALSFYKETVQKGVTASERAAMLSGLAASFSEAAKPFGYRVAAGMSALVETPSSSDRFQLALSLAKETRSWALAVEHYRKIDAKSPQYSMALNNIGVVLHSFDKSAASDFYYRATKDGNPMAAANLAHQLIGDGYYGLAEQILGSVQEDEEAAEQIAAARASALSRKREMGIRLEEIFALTADEAQKYGAVISRAMRAMESKEGLKRGIYGSLDGDFLVMIDFAGAACKFEIGTLSFEGVLTPTPVGFDGELRVRSQGLLGNTLTVSLFQTKSEHAEAIIWPNSFAREDRLRIVDLPIRQPALSASNSLLASTPSES